MNALGLRKWSLKDSVLGRIAAACHNRNLKSQDNSKYFSFGQYFDQDPQEGIYGTACAAIALYLHEPNNHTVLLSDCRKWLTDQHTRADSVSQRKCHFHNNYKYAFFLWALYPNLEEFTPNSSHDKYFKEFLDRRNTTSMGWSSWENLPSDPLPLHSEYDMYSTAFALFVLRFYEPFRSERTSGQLDAKATVTKFLDRVEEHTREGCPPQETRFLLSISLILIQDLPQNISSNANHTGTFLKRLLGTYAIRKYERSDLDKFNITIKTRMRWPDGTIMPISKYIYVQTDSLVLASLCRFYSVLSRPWVYVKIGRLVRKLCDLLYSDFRGQGKLYQPNDLPRGQYALVDHCFIAYTSAVLIGAQPRMLKHEKRLVTWILTICIVLVIPFLLLPIGVNVLHFAWTLIIFPLLMLLFKKTRKLIFDKAEF